MAVRSALHKRNLDLVRDPFPVRIATALDHLRIETVVDVGANVGQYSDGLRASGYRGRIVSFEPLADAYARLARRCAFDPGWTASREALGAEPGELELNVVGELLLVLVAADDQRAHGCATRPRSTSASRRCR